MKNFKQFIELNENARYTVEKFTEDLNTWGIDVDKVKHEGSYYLVKLKRPHEKLIIEFKPDVNVVVYDENYEELLSSAIARHFQPVGRTVAEFIKKEL